MPILNRLFDRLRVRFGNVEYGKLIILLGERGTGKSETVKRLCNSLHGNKYVVHFDENLEPLPIHQDDRESYQNINGCQIIENDEEIQWNPGIFIMEDFPRLTERGQIELYNQIRNIRHTQMNFLIVAQDYDAVKGIVFRHSNVICLYQNAAITPHQFKPRFGGGLRPGWGIYHALQDLNQYHYILVSLEHRGWIRNQLNSRDTNILYQYIRGMVNNNHFEEINYQNPNRIIAQQNRNNNRILQWEIIEDMLKEDEKIDEIASALNTTYNNIWRTTTRLRNRYLIDNPGEDLPYYLRDRRRRGNQ